MIWVRIQLPIFLGNVVIKLNLAPSTSKCPYVVKYTIQKPLLAMGFICVSECESKKRKREREGERDKVIYSSKMKTRVLPSDCGPSQINNFVNFPTNSDLKFGFDSCLP